MFRKIKVAGPAACAIVLGSAVLLGQVPNAQKVPGAEASSPVDTGTSAADSCVECELPIVLRQPVEAGKTAVGTKVEAGLVMATMINGAVLPRGAVISGEVTESVAKSNNSPSRLAIRMDSAQWKNGEAKFKVYLTAWYYPPARADGASRHLLWTAGRQKELGRSQSHRRYHRSTQSGSAVVDSAGQWCERGCARIDHLWQTGSNEEYEISERPRRLGCSCFFALKHQTQQGDNVCPRN